MNRPVYSRFVLVAIIALSIILVSPVSGVVTPDKTVSPEKTLSVAEKPTVSATVSAATPVVGDPVTISGVATGGNLSAGVQVWIFAGNYVNVTTVPVQADGSYSATYQTTGLPPATYYVFVQAPGADGRFNIGLETSGRFSGQVVDVQTGSVLVNFTGTGSVQNAAAASALSDALNRRDVDDVYTKTTFQLVAPSATATTVVTTASATVPVTPVPTTKSPISPVTVLLGLGIGGLAIIMGYRR